MVEKGDWFAFWQAKFRAMIANEFSEMTGRIWEVFHIFAKAHVEKFVLYGTKAKPDCVEEPGLLEITFKKLAVKVRTYSILYNLMIHVKVEGQFPQATVDVGSEDSR